MCLSLLLFVILVVAGSGGWMGGMRNQQPVHMGMPYNNFASYYGQEVPYGGYSSYPDNGMSDSQGSL